MAHRELERQNSLGSSIIIFVVAFALFLGSIYSFYFLTLSNVWPCAFDERRVTDEDLGAGRLACHRISLNADSGGAPSRSIDPVSGSH